MTNWVIIPTRNCLPLLKNTIDSVLAQKIRGGVKLFIINNGSTDGTAQFLNNISLELATVVHIYPQNGVGHAWNLGLREVFKDSNHALVVNHDVLLRPDCYSELLSFGHEFITGVSTDDISKLNDPLSDWLRGRPNPDFSCFLIKKNVFETVGPFDELPCGFYEDNMYHIRMHRAKIQALCVDIPFYHFASATLKLADKKDRAVILKAAQNNREEFYSRYECYPGTKEYEQLFDLGDFGYYELH